MTNNVTNKWEELKALVESLEDDVQKNATGNKAAGTRARRDSGVEPTVRAPFGEEEVQRAGRAVRTGPNLVGG